MTTDVVYVLGTGSVWDDNELRFSLRSLELFLEDMGQVFVVGHRPRWLTGVTFLPFPDLVPCKERNIMLKLARACGHPDLSDTFLHVHDDHFALAPAIASETPNWAGISLDRVGHAVKVGNHWRDAVLNTYRVLAAAGHPVHNFDLHLPILIDKNLYPQTMDRYDWRGTERGFVVKSLYANTLHVEPVMTSDNKMIDRLPMADLVTRLKGRRWFSVGNSGLNLNLKNLITALYPEPSRFERP